MTKNVILIIIVLVGILILEGCKKENNEPDEIVSTVFDEMSGQGLLENMDLEQFIDNANSSKEILNIQENYVYDSNLDQTTMSISVSPKSGSVRDVSLISYIPKEAATSASEIDFDPRPTEIVRDDPVIMWHLFKLDKEINIKIILQGDKTPDRLDTFVVTDNGYIVKDEGITYDDFGITELKYNDYHWRDWPIYVIFGPEYRAADWNDLKNYHENGGDLLELFDELGLNEQGTSVLITRDGNTMWNSTRYYVASRHEHNKPGSYLAHDNIDNFLVSLGSWYDMKLQILAIKK